MTTAATAARRVSSRRAAPRAKAHAAQPAQEFATEDQAEGCWVDHHRSTTPSNRPVATATASTTGVAGPTYDGERVAVAGERVRSLLMASSLVRRTPAGLALRYRTAGRRCRRRTVPARRR